MTVTTFCGDETSLGGPNLIFEGGQAPYELISLKGGEENGDVYKNGVGLGSVSGVCDRVHYRQQFLYHVDRYQARPCSFPADAENHSPRRYDPGAF